MRYVELHAHSYYSLLDGAVSPVGLVQQAAALGMNALALTDHDAVYGIPTFIQAARKAGIHPIIGAELTLHDDSHITLLVRNEQGWHHLCALITLARHHAPKGEARLPEEGLIGHTAGLIALSGCRLGRIPAAIRQGNLRQAFQAAQAFIDLFGHDHFFIELQQHRLNGDRWLNAELADLAAQVGVGIVATNNVHYATAEGHALQDVLVCIREKTTLDEARRLRPNSEYALKSAEDMTVLFHDYPEAIANTVKIAAACTFDLPHGLQELPVFPTPGGITADAYLRHLTIARANRLELPANAFDQIHHELQVIHASQLSNYFLIVWDIVQFARSKGMLCQGRGSAANSIIAYLLDISPVNPLTHQLVFERFLSRERQIVPDIDIDFDNARREEVIQYVYERYGHAHVAMACTFVTFRARSAIRDIGKALGLPLDLLEHVTTTLDAYKARDLQASVSIHDALGSQIDSATWLHILKLSQQIDGFPRHLGIHNGGMVITGAPLSHRLPTEPATMADRFVTQWDKEGLEDAGMVKIDILGLGVLAAITEAVQLAAEFSGQAIDLNNLTFDDPAVYEMICQADTVGVFQVESRAQAQVLPRLKPRLFNDLIISISLIRPGPVQGNMVHPYLRRRDGVEPITYFHPLLEEALRETLGVILFQEQCLKVAQALAGFTPGQGELLRRALGSKHAADAVEKLHQAFVEGAVAKGVEADVAETVFDKLRAFASYSFAKSHAASFAVLVYWSAWLKHYYPAAFAAALLNNQPMGFWSPAIILRDAERHHIPVYPVDINRSQYRCTLEWQGIRLGFTCMTGLTEITVKPVYAARLRGAFIDLDDFCRRVALPRTLIENLIAAGAMDGWGPSRRDLVWKLGLQQQRDTLTLPASYDHVPLPALSEAEKSDMEYRVTGLSTGQHPIAFYRSPLHQKGILTSLQLKQAQHGTIVWVAGLIVVHQSPPTAKGHHFITLEDEFDFINLIVKPSVYVQFRRVIRGASLLLAQGQVQRQGSVINLIVIGCRPLNEQSISNWY